MEFLSEIISFVLGLASGLTIKIVYDTSRKNTSTTQQRDINTKGGDVAGRDIKK